MGPNGEFLELVDTNFTKPNQAPSWIWLPDRCPRSTFHPRTCANSWGWKGWQVANCFQFLHPQQIDTKNAGPWKMCNLGYQFVKFQGGIYVCLLKGDFVEEAKEWSSKMGRMSAIKCVWLKLLMATSGLCEWKTLQSNQKEMNTITFTLAGTNISLLNAVGKMSFLVHWYTVDSDGHKSNRFKKSIN